MCVRISQQIMEIPFIFRPLLPYFFSFSLSFIRFPFDEDPAFSVLDSLSFFFFSPSSSSVCYEPVRRVRLIAPFQGVGHSGLALKESEYGGLYERGVMMMIYLQSSPPKGCSHRQGAARLLPRLRLRDDLRATPNRSPGLNPIGPPIAFPSNIYER